MFFRQTPIAHGIEPLREQLHFENGDSRAIEVPRKTMLSHQLDELWRRETESYRAISAVRGFLKGVPYRKVLMLSHLQLKIVRYIEMQI